jgi:hypothetical protein
MRTAKRSPAAVTVGERITDGYASSEPANLVEVLSHHGYRISVSVVRHQKSCGV